jgi:CheY-like chemotaxis protein
MTDLALDTDLSSEQREYLEMVKLSAESLLSLLNDILDFSKIEAGRLDIDLYEFKIRDDLGDTMDTLSLRAHSKDIELAFHVAPDVPFTLIGDSRRLRQVVVNLVGNAIKFTNMGEVVLDVAVQKHDGDDIELHFMVSDTGIGIPDEHQKRIFEAFAQVDSSTTRRYGGTGLGLSISSQLVNLMHGHMWVESALGEGSKFHFTASFKIGEGVDEPAVDHEEVDLKGLSVLVVDDNATNRRILNEMLLNWDMRPYVASSAAEAIELYRDAARKSDPISIVLLDSMMPNVDGFMLAEQLKSLDDYSSVSMMMLSSADRYADAARCRQIGVGAYLTKPIKQSTLFDALVVAAASKRKPRDPATVSHKSDPEPVAPVPQGRTLNLLLAEDNLVNQKLAVRILEKRGHSVTVAANGALAVEFVKKKKFDLVLMDVQMPEMDGLEATGLIREYEKETGEHIPIVALTAHAMKGDRERCLSAGMDFYVSKPIQPQELLEVIDSLTQSYNDDQSGSGDDASVAFDLNAAMERVEGDNELFVELIDLFFDQSPALIAQIQDAIAAGNPVALQNAAHSLKGAISNFEAHGAFEAAFKLEVIGKDEMLDEAGEALQALDAEVLKLTSALAVYRQDQLA